MTKVNIVKQLATLCWGAALWRILFPKTVGKHMGGVMPIYGLDV